MVVIGPGLCKAQAGVQRLFRNKESVDHINIGQVRVDGGNLPVTETHNRRQVFVEYQIPTSSRVIQRKRDPMPANQNVLEAESQSITHDELCPVNNRIDTLGFPGNKTASG